MCKLSYKNRFNPITVKKNKRSIRLEIRLNQHEHEVIDERLATSKLDNISDFIRYELTGRLPYHLVTEPLLNLSVQLKKNEEKLDRLIAYVLDEDNDVGLLPHEKAAFQQLWQAELDSRQQVRAVVASAAKAIVAQYDEEYGIRDEMSSEDYERVRQARDRQKYMMFMYFLGFQIDSGS